MKGYVYKICEEDGWDPILIEKNSDEYNRINSIIQESKSLEEQLNELLIEMEYIYIGEAALSQYIKDNLAVKERTVNVVEQAGISHISITSNVDEKFILEYGARRDSSTGRYLEGSIGNENIDMSF